MAKNGRQTDIPGTTSAKDKKLRSIANNYLDARQQHRDATETLKGYKTELIEALKERELSFYQDGEFRIELEQTDKVKVRSLDEDSGDED